MKKKFIIASMVLLCLVLLVSCSPSYKVVLEEQVDTDNITPITLEQAVEIQRNEAVVTFVIKDNGISVDKVVNIGKFHSGAQADTVFMVINDSASPVTPVIYYMKDKHIDDYSEVEGQGYVDAPAYVEGWITVSPTPEPIPSKSAQGYIVSLVMPENAEKFADKFAFAMGVEGQTFGVMQPTVGTWFLVNMR